MKLSIFRNYIYKYNIKICQEEQKILHLLVKNYKAEEHYTTYYKDSVLIFSELSSLKEKLTKIFDELNLKIIHAWVQGYGQEDKHVLHTHGDAMYSSILYLNCTKNSSETVFYHPLYPHHYFYKIKKEKIIVKPKVGKLIIFPSYIAHEVKPNKDRSRLIMSLNAVQKDDKKYYKY
jgi:uncharacterized protein (TIGR02466 family)